MPSRNSYIHEDYQYLLVSPSGEITYKAREDYDFAELLELVRNDNEELISKIKKVVFDPFLDDSESSGARLLADDRRRWYGIGRELYINVYHREQ